MASSNFVGNQAIVLGAGMGGLAAAAALSEFFERVTVLERDVLPEKPAQRSGTPQGRHVHGLLMGGQNALEELLPGFHAELAKGGAVPVRTVEFLAEIPGFDPFPRRDFGWTNYFMSRPLIEFTVRKLVSRIDNVEIRDRSRVLRLEGTPNGTGSISVIFERNDARTDTLKADLVVDATGRAVPTLTFLKSADLPLPEETEIGVDFAYGTAIFEIPADALGDWKVVQSLPDPAASTARGGLLAP